MARKRQRRRAANTKATTPYSDQSPNGIHNHGGINGNGVQVHVRNINSTADEGVLYTHKITERHPGQRMSTLSKLTHLFSRNDSNDNASSVGSVGSGFRPYRRSISRTNSMNIIGSTLPPTPRSPPPQSDTLRGFRTFFGKHQKQYTIASKKKYRSNLLNWFDKHHMNFVDYFCHANEVDNNVYRPSTTLYRYIDWTFTASFTAVFLTFLFFYCALCLIFGGLLLVAGRAQPNCIVASGASFGATPHTEFSDAFALSWTTFTTVGYGMTYTTTGSDFKNTEPHECTWVVFLCTSEAFLGLLFAGMCAAILFGKVNRVQSHANILFCNAVCLQYEEEEDDYVEPIHSERSAGRKTPKSSSFFDPDAAYTIPLPDLDDEKAKDVPYTIPLPDLDDELDEENQMDAAPQSQDESKFVDQFNGCPILKFQVVNELCNREGGELVDCIMKVIGIKFKGPGDGTVTHSQYVRVNLVDFEHPFLSRCWHGVHILDSTSPLLTDQARQRIRQNNGSWPSHWFDPEIIRSKLEFHDLVVTVAGISNVSAVTVHAYKRYKIGDVLIGYNFAPIVFRDPDSGNLEVDLSMINDVREQSGIRGEDLSVRRSGSKEYGSSFMRTSTIRIKKSKSGDGLGSVTSHHSNSSKGLGSRLPSPRESIAAEASPEKSTKPTTTVAMSPLALGDDMLDDPSEDDIAMVEAIVQPKLDIEEAKED